MIVESGIYVLIIVSTIYLFVCVDGNGGGPMATIKRFLWITLPETGKRIGTRVCGERITKFLFEKAPNYLCYSANPIVQFLYCALAGGGFYCYVVYGFPHMPGPYIDGYHKIIGSILMFVCYYTYYKACTVNPGRIPTDRAGHLKCVKRFKFDEILFTKKQQCRTCEVEKPARSKHCSMCGFCVEKYDHHCVWINQCVGLYNYRWFLAFLWLHSILCGYGAIAAFCIFCNIIHKEELLTATFVNNVTGERFAADWNMIFRYLLQTQQVMFGLSVLCVVICIMLQIFIMYHLYLIRLGVTTNESIKISNVKHMLHRALSFMEEWKEKKEAEAKGGKAFKPSAECLERYLAKADYSLKTIGQKIKAYKQEIEELNTSPYKVPFVRAL